MGRAHHLITAKLELQHEVYLLARLPMLRLCDKFVKIP